MLNEAVINRNLLAIKQHSEETRKLLRELEEKNKIIDDIKNKVELLEKQIETLFKRL